MRRNPDTHGFSKSLKANQTDAEKKLWFQLRARRFLGIHFKRQVPIGNFIVDFCSTQQRLIIELDGGQHAEHQAADEKRTEFLISEGYRVLRFWNNEVMGNLDGILEVLKRE